MGTLLEVLFEKQHQWILTVTVRWSASIFRSRWNKNQSQTDQRSRWSFFI